MATLEGTVTSVEVIKGNDRDPLMFAAVYFTIAGTYVQADDATILAVPTLIQNSRRNGKTVTMISAAMWQPARKASNGHLLTPSAVTIDSTAVDFGVVDQASATSIAGSTELAAGAFPAQGVPFGLLIGFRES